MPCVVQGGTTEPAGVGGAAAAAAGAAAGCQVAAAGAGGTTHNSPPGDQGAILQAELAKVGVDVMFAAKAIIRLSQ